MTSQTSQTNHTDEDNMDNEKSGVHIKIAHLLGASITIAMIICKLANFGVFSCSNNYANDYARFNIDGLTAIRDDEIIDMQWHLVNNNQRISVDEVIDLGFEKNGDGYFAVTWSHLPASSPGNSWRLQEAVKFSEVTRFEEVVPNFIPKIDE